MADSNSDAGSDAGSESGLNSSIDFNSGSDSGSNPNLNQAHAYLKAMGIEVWHERLLGRAKVPSKPEFLVSKQEISDLSPMSQEILTESESASVKSGVMDEVYGLKKESVTTINIGTFDWQTLHSVVNECHRCELSQSRTQTIFSSGNLKASLMLIGEAPDAEEEQLAEPFVGKTGQLLTAMLKAIGYQRSDVYLTNITKCRPPEDREPAIEETESCWPYLQRQIELVQPDLILVLGRIAAQRLLKSKSSLGRLRGKIHYIENINIPVVVSYHPAYLLQAPSEKRRAWEDLKMAIKQLRSGTENEFDT